MRRYASLLLLIIFLCCFLASCSLDIFLSDEKQIERRIEAFVSAYNDGDVEEAMNSMSKKTRNTCKALFSLAGIIIGVDISELFNSLFTLGIATGEGEFMTVEIDEIDVVSENRAVVKARISFRDDAVDLGKEEGYFVMVKEDDDWLISDITETTPK